MARASPLPAMGCGGLLELVMGAVVTVGSSAMEREGVPSGAWVRSTLEVGARTSLASLRGVRDRFREMGPGSINMLLYATCTHTYTYTIHTYTHTTYTHTLTNTHFHTRAHTHSHILTHIYIYTHKHINT